MDKNQSINIEFENDVYLSSMDKLYNLSEKEKNELKELLEIYIYDVNNTEKRMKTIIKLHEIYRKLSLS
jgi:RNase P subunit RPR2